MTFEKAKTLQVGDEVVIKESHRIVHVAEKTIIEEDREVFFQVERCDDGIVDTDYFYNSELSLIEKVTHSFFSDDKNTIVALKRFLRNKEDGWGWNIIWGYSKRPDGSGVDFKFKCRQDQANEISHFLVRRTY